MFCDHLGLRRRLRTGRDSRPNSLRGKFSGRSAEGPSQLAQPTKIELMEGDGQYCLIYAGASQQCIQCVDECKRTNTHTPVVEDCSQATNQ